ncbi:MAG: dihydroorotate dehydrogenase-like protein [Anaerolineae bacterium]|nr:dihydroorotate dehydrogenase-like protein [Anaerolineae bacterium]
MDLTTTYLGMKLRSPLVVSASPLSEEISNIKHMEDAGAGAVVLYSLFEEQLALEQYELNYHTTHGTESFAEALTYFPEPEEFHVGPEGYLEHIRKAKEAVDIPVIASLNGTSLDGWTDFAKLIEQAGADALELNLYTIPMDMNVSGALVEQRDMQVVEAVKQALSIPVAVKLSPFFSNMAFMAKKLDEAGADSLVLFNRFYQPDINLETLEVYPHVLLSTSYDMRLPLRWIAILFDRINADLAATSGVHQAKDVLKMVMAGANVTMMASALMKYGIDHIRTVETDLHAWMVEHEYESITQMHGSMSYRRSGESNAFERAQYMRAVSSLPPEFLP